MSSFNQGLLLCAALALPAADAAAATGGAVLPCPPASLERGRRDLPKVALTFDGGSDAGESRRILDVLEERGAVATFFLTGAYIEHNPQLVLQIAAGHQVGNHTWSHPHLTSWDRNGRHDTLPGRDRGYLLAQLRRTAAAYEALTGRRMSPLWRAPYGEVNRELLRWAADEGWRHAGWTRDDDGGRHTLDSLDWVADRNSRNYRDSAQIVERILTFGEQGEGLNGGIVLMHLSTRRDDPAVARLGDLVDGLRSRGYQLVTLAELLQDLEDPPPALAAVIRLP